MRGKKIDGFATKEKVLSDLFSLWTPIKEKELVPIEESIGRITASRIYSVNTLPVHRTSACDGIAVSSKLFNKGMPNYTLWIEGNEFQRADTGDDFDDRYDAIIMIEEVDFTAEGTIKFISDDIDITPGINISKSGSIILEGDKVMDSDLPIRPTDLAALAIGGCTMVPVRKKPRVAFVPTGTELIPAQMKPERGKNIDTNSLLIKESLISLGADPIIFPIIPDDKDLLEQALEEALCMADIVVINGGTAKGEEDYNTLLIKEKGKILHHYVAAAPGRPLAIGIIHNKPIINLPGPTIATFFGEDWCLTAIVCKALNIPMRKKETVVCTLTEDIITTPHMAILCRLEVKKSADEHIAEPKSFFTGDMVSCLTSNGMYVSPIGESVKKAGDKIEVELLRNRGYIL